MSDDDTDLLSPRQNPNLEGEGLIKAEQVLLDAYRSGKLPHAWLITGQRGIGKATLAYRFARYLLNEGEDNDLLSGDLLAGPPEERNDLYVSPDRPVFRRVAGSGHADLLSVVRTPDPKTGRMRSVITVDDVRGIGGFLRLTSAEGGWRVVIIDCADELNRNAANAVLKLLEEPPAQSVLLLVSHVPGRLLPTIRSRCRQLHIPPLSTDTVVGLLAHNQPALSSAEAHDIARLSEGSIGRALTMAEEGGLDLYRNVFALLEGLPRLDIAALHNLGGKIARPGEDASYKTVQEMINWWLARLIRFSALGGGINDTTAPEQALMERLSSASGLDRWLEVWEKISRLFAQADTVKLDRKQVILDVFLSLENTARN